MIVPPQSAFSASEMDVRGSSLERCGVDPLRCPLAVTVEQGAAAIRRIADCEALFAETPGRPLSEHPRWLAVVTQGLRHDPFMITAIRDGKVQAMLPLAYIRSWLFGRFLISLPYVNYGGVIARHQVDAAPLIDAALRLANQLGVRFLQLRHESEVEHCGLTTRSDLKVHMRRPLPGGAEELWKSIGSSVRNQVRRGQKGDFLVAWGTLELVDEFYDVFSTNMRDLGTPVFGRRLFRVILEEFTDAAEVCVLRDRSRPVAVALLLHGSGTTEVLSASTLREYNKSCANMFLYWNLLLRAVERGQGTFDFGRSSPESGSHRFKKQWGAQPSRACWQFYIRQGDITSMQRENPRYEQLIRMWRHLPTSVSRFVGPIIARAIP